MAGPAAIGSRHRFHVTGGPAAPADRASPRPELPRPGTVRPRGSGPRRRRRSGLGAGREVRALAAAAAAPPDRFKKSRRESPAGAFRRSRGCRGNLVSPPSTGRSTAARSRILNRRLALVTYGPPARTPSLSAPFDPPVVVAGAGFAGLTAAFRLLTAGVPTAVLEARDRVGGRVHQPVSRTASRPSWAPSGSRRMPKRCTRWPPSWVSSWSPPGSTTGGAGASVRWAPRSRSRRRPRGCLPRAGGPPGTGRRRIARRLPPRAPGERIAARHAGRPPAGHVRVRPRPGPAAGGRTRHLRRRQRPVRARGGPGTR